MPPYIKAQKNDDLIHVNHVVHTQMMAIPPGHQLVIQPLPVTGPIVGRFMGKDVYLADLMLAIGACLFTVAFVGTGLYFKYLKHMKIQELS